MSSSIIQPVYVIRLKTQNSNKWLGSYNKNSHRIYKNNIVYFKAPTDAIRIKDFIKDYHTKFARFPELHYYNDRLNDLDYTEDTEDYIKEYTIEYPFTDELNCMQQPICNDIIKEELEICKFKEDLLYLLSSVNNLGIIECKLNYQDQIQYIGHEKRIQCAEKTYKDYLNILYYM
jgi:hypothetical protein